MSWSRMIEALLNPIGLIWAVNSVLAIRFAVRRQWKKTIFFGGVALFLFVTGSTTAPGRLLASLEKPYRGTDWEKIPPANGIILLGGGLSRSPEDIFGYGLSEGADRILTALELMRRGKGGIVLVGGAAGAKSGMSAEGEFLERLNQALGLTNQFHFLKPSKNTYDEAAQIRELYDQRRWTNLILVTSAYHMRRSVALFRHCGVSVQPVACDFAGTDTLELKLKWNPVPRAENLQELHIYLHEQMGWLYYRMRGWIGPKTAS